MVALYVLTARGCSVGVDVVLSAADGGVELLTQSAAVVEAVELAADGHCLAGDRLSTVDVHLSAVHGIPAFNELIFKYGDIRVSISHQVLYTAGLSHGCYADGILRALFKPCDMRLVLLRSRRADESRLALLTVGDLILLVFYRA